MAKVICTLENASAEISGIKFVTHRLGMISEEIDDARAKELATIPGYLLHDSVTGGGVGEKATAETGSGSVSNVTAESLAELALSLNAVDRQRLVQLLLQQQASGRQPPPPPSTPPKTGTRRGTTTAAPAAPAGGAPAGGSTAPSGSPDESGASELKSDPPSAPAKVENPTF